MFSIISMTAIIKLAMSLGMAALLSRNVTSTSLSLTHKNLNMKKICLHFVCRCCSSVCLVWQAPYVNAEIFVATIFCGLNFCGDKFLWMRAAHENLTTTKI